MENLNPNIQLWQNHKQLKAACVVIGGTGEPCKRPVLPSQPLIKLEFRAHLQHDFLLRLFSDGAMPVIPNYNTPWTEKSTLGGKNLPILIVSSHYVETCSQKVSSELLLFSQHNPHVPF